MIACVVETREPLAWCRLTYTDGLTDARDVKKGKKRRTFFQKKREKERKEKQQQPNEKHA